MGDARSRWRWVKKWWLPRATVRRPFGRGPAVPRRGYERGASAVEFALIATVFALILMAFFDMGRVVYFNSAVEAAAQEGARAYAGNPSLTTNQLKTIILSKVVGLDSDSLSVTVSTPDSRTVEVSVTYPYQPITPLLQPFFSPGYQVTATTRLRY